MRKIPTLFKRDPDDMKRVLPEVHPDCQWVLDGEGVATRKYDGTCVMLDDSGQWWARREVKPGKTPPPNYRPEQHDEATGKAVGWEPIEQSPFVKAFRRALLEGEVDEDTGDGVPREFAPGTYELCGPKVQGNPERYPAHRLVRHADAERYPALNMPLGIDELRTALRSIPWEGIVWHHPDGRMAKLKARDFPTESEAEHG